MDRRSIEPNAMESGGNSAIWKLADRTDREWKTLRNADGLSTDVRAELARRLAHVAPPDDVSVVVFGSLARGEITVGSDIDWALLVDAPASSGHLDTAFKVKDAVTEISEEFDLKKGVGREGTFGALAFSHDIIHKIGGENDTNRNLTQRILLLLESAAIGHAEAYNRVLNGVLDRYIREDFGYVQRSINVPRFLLNDIARYWRTVAVDFAYKRRRRRGEGWALRTIKLRLSRKMTFVAGLLLCFRVYRPEGEVDDPQSVVDELEPLIRQSPLDLLASTALVHPSIEGAVVKAVDAYDEFLEMLSDSDARQHLDNLPAAKAIQDEEFKRARELGHEFQAALDRIFFEAEGTDFPTLIRKYGVF